VIALSFEIRDNSGEILESWELSVKSLDEYRALGRRLTYELSGTEEEGWIVTFLEGQKISEMRII